MKLSIVTDEKHYASADEMFETLHSAGFEAVDYLGRNLGQLNAREESAYCKGLLDAARRHGMEIGQTHAPTLLLTLPEEDYFEKEFTDRVNAAIERTARLGARYMAFHPYCPPGMDFFVNGNPYDYSKLIEHNKEVNLELMARYEPKLRQEGVVLCIENLFAYDILMQRHVLSVCGDADETNFYIDRLGEKWYAACYDSGHLNHFGADEGQYIEKLGNRLKILHLNDSWGKHFHGMDWHLMPGQGDVDWEKIAGTLGKIGYDGMANFEVDPREGFWFLPQLKYIGEVGNAIFNAKRKETSK